MPEADPPPPSPTRIRDHLANERTLLAWMRTGVAVIGLGFIVARFGLLIRELGASGPRHLPQGASTVFGVLLVVCGVALLFLANRRYQEVGHAIESNDFVWSSDMGKWLTTTLAMAGGLLALYLVLTA